MSDRFDWAHIKERIVSILQRMSPIQWYGAQRGLLQGLGISEIAGYDGDPSLLLDSAVMKMSYDEARQEIFDTAVKLLEDQLNWHGPTLFLDIEKLRDTSASKLIPLIVEKRKEELENSTILVKGSKVFLRPLWITHYGFNVLSASGMGLATDLDGLETLRKSFDELDMELTTQKVTEAKDVYEGNVSQGMQKHVFDLIRGVFD